MSIFCNDEEKCGCCCGDEEKDCGDDKQVCNDCDEEDGCECGK
jgi:hypothetical protein